ncbi:prepilin-type N-terminal cleavage/methylation domain-containing protein [Cellvibrio sp.]|uniref:type IV pilus modification PilV family protein n=1 Tax=Cellvibrio sp. TaxID=1965322 RepID=UPI00396479E6
MHINASAKLNMQQGISLIELIVFLVIVSIASSALMATYINSVRKSADPIIAIRALELAQARLDEILALKYDANTPTGGIPACDSSAVGAATCDNLPDADMNDVDDYNNVTDTPYAGYTRSVSVTAVANNQKLITVSVTVTAPRAMTYTLAAYKANF